MPAEADARIGQMEGPAALPRSNGELVFQAPWEGRAFGLAVSLYDSGRYPWPEFSQRLATEIAADDQPATERYYEHWLAAFEQLLLDEGLLSQQELDARTRDYESGARATDED